MNLLQPVLPGLRIAGCAILSLSAATHVFAQQKAAPASPAPEETLVLPLFEVTHQDDNSMDASSSISASRIAEKNQNLPYGVNVVTAELLNAIGSFDYKEALGYTSSFTDNEDETQMTLRGISGGRIMVNGFSRQGLVDPDSISRIEVIKGPAAALYGRTKPGGVVNIIQRQPSNKRSVTFSYQAGNYDSRKSSVTLRGPFGGWLPSTYYSLNVGEQKRTYEQIYRDMNQENVNLTLAHRLGDNTNLRLNIDYVNRENYNGSTIPILAGGVSGWVPKELWWINSQGPNTYFHRELKSLTFQADRQFSPAYSANFSLNWSIRDDARLRYNGGGTFNPANRQITGRNAEYVDQKNWDRGARLDNVFTGRFWGLDSTTLVTGEWSFKRPRYRVYRPTSGNISTLNIDAPNWHIVPYDPAVYTNNTANRDQQTHVYGLLVREQVKTKNEKLVAYVAARQDWISDRFVNHRDTTGLAGVVQRGSRDHLSTMGGASFYVLPHVPFYASFAQTFDTQTASSGNLIGVNEVGQPLETERGRGTEFGIKPELLDGRLSFTFAYSQTTQYNVLENDNYTDPVTGNTIAVQLAGGEYKTNGFEFDASWRVTPHFQVIPSFGFFDPKITASGRDVDAIGRRKPGVSAQSGGLLVIYSFSKGRLDGLRTILRYRYHGDIYPLSRTGGTDANGNNIIDVGEGSPQRDWRIPSYGVVGVTLSYPFRISKQKIDTSLYLNNILDKQYLNANRTPGDRFSFGVRMSLRL